MKFFSWFVNLLRKLGILQTYKSSYKGNLKDRPTDFIDTGDNN